MKKLLFTGHPYHEKTKSTQFLINLLTEYYDVELRFDDTWQKKSYVEINKSIEPYDVVIFFQILPPNVAKNIQHPNATFFPMYDASYTWRYLKWLKYGNIKIFNFSKTLHDKLSAWGFHSKHLQYFIQPKDFIEESNCGVFFWQRRDSININTVEQLFASQDVNIHIHKSIDPSYTFKNPTKEQENRFNISYSTWFDTKQEMQECIQSKTFYIAPRIFEGIGMSFLEAMAMGKIVIANNQATMNEYIKDGETGYLCDFKNPKMVNIGNVDELRRNIYAFMKQGYENWEARKHEIVDFIESENIPPKLQLHPIFDWNFLKKFIYRKDKWENKKQLTILSFIRITTTID